MTGWVILLISVPLVCGLIGWLTNVVAVKMIFRPREPVRVLGVPLRGVLPKHLPHFAHQLAEIVSSDFMTTAEMVERVDLEALLEGLGPRIDAAFYALWAEMMPELGEGQREMLDNEVMEAARQKLHEELRAALPDARCEIAAHADEMVDLRATMERKIVDFGPARLEEIIYSIAGRELRFIELYGAGFGLTIGALQAGVLALAPLYWELPLVGMLVGAVTNYLAIQMLFSPREPWRLGPFTLQGLFPKRQAEIAKAQADVAARDLILVEEVFWRLRERLIPRRVEGVMMDRVEELFRERYPSAAAVADALLTSEQRDQLRCLLAAQLRGLGQDIADEVIAAAAEQLDIASIMSHKISSLPRLRFEQLLRGLFKQEELYLVIYGALLGGGMGLVQLIALALVG